MSKEKTWILLVSMGAYALSILRYQIYCIILTELLSNSSPTSFNFCPKEVQIDRNLAAKAFFFKLLLYTSLYK